jgi:hypothetical protein
VLLAAQRILNERVKLDKPAELQLNGSQRSAAHGGSVYLQMLPRHHFHGQPAAKARDILKARVARAKAAPAVQLSLGLSQRIVAPLHRHVLPHGSDSFAWRQKQRARPCLRNRLRQPFLGQLEDGANAQQVRVVHVCRLQVPPQSVALLLKLAAPFRVPDSRREVKKETAGRFETINNARTCRARP